MQQRSWRIWLVTDVYPPDSGGSGWSTHALALALVDRAHRVEVISRNPDRADVARRCYEGIEVAEVGLRSARRDPRRRLGARDYSFGLLERYLTGRLRETPDVDILHAQHLHSGPPTIQVGLAHGLATVVTIRDYWPVCLHGTSWWGSANCPGCTTANLTSCMTEVWSWPRPAARVMVGWAGRRVRARGSAVASAHQVLAVSEAVKHRIEGEMPGANLSVVSNMVDPQRLEAALPAAGDDGVPGPYLLTAGKLLPTKGFDLLLTSLGHVGCPLPLVVAGDGPMRAALKRQAQALGLPVTFLGWVSHERLLRLQRDAHAVLLPSAWHEPLSRLVLETMGLGTPVVAWARGGNPEMIQPGVTGWLVHDGDDLAAALSALSSPDVRRQVGRAGRERVITCYAPAVVYPAMAAVYASASETAALAGPAIRRKV